MLSFRDYEQHLLATLLTGDMVSYATVSDIIKPEYFEDKFHRYIFSTICKINQSTQDRVDYITVLEYAEQDKRLTKAQLLNIYDTVNDLMQSRFITLYNYKHYVTKFMEQVKKKELKLIGKQLTETELHNITDYIETIKQQLNRIQEKNVVQTLATTEECADDLISYITDYDSSKLIRSGFDIDYIIGGFRPKQLIIIAARPQIGKTAFILSSLVKMAEKGKRVNLYTMEMGKDEITQRITSTQIHVPLENLINPDKLTDEQIEAVTLYHDHFSKLPIYIHDNGTCSPAKIEADINKQALINQKPDIIIVDGIELVQGDKAKYESDFARISDISRNLKLLAMRSNIPIIAVSQVNRNCEDRKDKRPELHDLRMTGNLEQDANIVIMLYRDEVYTKDKCTEPGVAEVFIRKNRNGKTGMRKLFYVGEYTEFSNMAISEN